MKEKIAGEGRARIIYLDYLRIFATIAVIILHVSAQNWYYVDLNSFEWKVFNCFDASVQWAVPIFVMISGALFLDTSREFNINKFYKQHVIKMIIVLVFWSFVYTLDKYFLGFDLRTCIAVFIQGNYHLWYLFMIIGLYVFTPIMRKIVESKRLTEYFLILAIIFSVIIPRVFFFLSCIDLPDINYVANNVSLAFKDMNIYMTEGYVLYYILGFYLSRYTLEKSHCKVIYLLGITAYFAMTILTDWYSKQLGNASGEFYSYFSVNVMLISISIFLFFKNTFSEVAFNTEKITLLKKLSKYTFGVYLVHAIVLEKICELFGISTLTFNPILSIIIISSGVLVVSGSISMIINRIPVLKTYIV